MCATASDEDLERSTSPRYRSTTPVRQLSTTPVRQRSSTPLSSNEDLERSSSVRQLSFPPFGVRGTNHVGINLLTNEDNDRSSPPVRCTNHVDLNLSTNEDNDRPTSPPVRGTSHVDLNLSTNEDNDRPTSPQRSFPPVRDTNHVDLNLSTNEDNDRDTTHVDLNLSTNEDNDLGTNHVDLNLSTNDGSSTPVHSLDGEDEDILHELLSTLPQEHVVQDPPLVQVAERTPVQDPDPVDGEEDTGGDTIMSVSIRGAREARVRTRELNVALDGLDAAIDRLYKSPKRYNF